jgi:predicted dehydrogenase
MVGGGSGAFIGAVHRMAASLDGRFALTAGALSSDAARSLASARELAIPGFRAYGTWQEMAEREAALPRDQRIDAVAIVTPNATHFAIARAFAERGIHLIIDKPMVTTLVDAVALREVVRKVGVVCCVTYNYSGYPMVRHAAHMVRQGAIGTVRKVVVEYHQGWLATALERTGQKQAAWRSDPAQAGGGGSIGDIGTHAEQLLRVVTGLDIRELSADLTSFVDGRALDDDAHILLRLEGPVAARGAKGLISVSQVCVGEKNNLTLRVYGERGSISWRQEEPNTLTHASLDGATTLLSRGVVDSPQARRATRLPPGHPEGFIEAFSNVYLGAADAMLAREAGYGGAAGGESLYPSVDDGVAGIAFIDACLRSSAAGGTWTQVAK